MNESRAVGRCDECGREGGKAHRVRHGHRYCGTCYVRVFKRRPCPKCGNPARLPKNHTEALCRRCENNRPCIRCGRMGRAIGKITAYGPVCNACSPHFREPEPCEECGALSQRLSRVRRLGHSRRVCPKCARADHATCPACARHRSLQEGPDGRMVCKPCAEKGEVPCPKCLAPMPAGLGNQCRRCYWRGLLEKRIQIDCAAFATQEMAAHFEAFGAWLGQRVGEHKAAFTIHRYLPFFTDIERQWAAIPDYGVLLAHFGTAKLRKVLLPMRWMEEARIVVRDDAAKAGDSDRRRITATLGKLMQGSEERAILEGYRDALAAGLKGGKMTLRTVRMALSPAAALLLVARKMESMPPDQRALDAYLSRTPGQRAGIWGFVRYLREAHGVPLTLPAADPARRHRERRKTLEAEMLALMTEGDKGKDFKRRWLAIALAYFHGLPKTVGRIASHENLNAGDGGILVSRHGKEYWVPKP